MHPLKAYEKHAPAAGAAVAAFRAMAPNAPRVPGMDTAIRMAVRIECGHDVETSAAREYLYRWRLALDAMESSHGRARPNPFASHYAPHALGM